MGYTTFSSDEIHTLTLGLLALIGLAYPLFNAFHTLYLGSRIPSSDASISTTESCSTSSLCAFAIWYVSVLRFHRLFPLTSFSAFRFVCSCRT
ncbi:hypothetical protein M378DRAFT_855419 [Amanita muscaria Koide BX008]|uniref:Uncharacterized protein n=1 Tax=Amanita muscaria (strain Koide BX008) TaxID=946122 RepID=A0A0C2WYG0_AMAMK|nr:hypothetical protein M378DRAFT_855419 [Amanita muscaria Koide BX008]